MPKPGVWVHKMVLTYVTAVPQNNDTNTFFLAVSTQIGNSTHFTVNCLISHSFQADYCFLRFIMMQTVINWLWNKISVSNFNIDEVQLSEIWQSARYPFWEFYFGIYGLPSNPELHLKSGYAIDSKYISWCDSNTWTLHCKKIPKNGQDKNKMKGVSYLGGHGKKKCLCHYFAEAL